MSGVQFNEIPSTIRVPGPYIEIDSSQANQQTSQNQRVLVIGQRRSTGTVTALTPTLVTSYQQAIDNFGVGSMLAVMFQALFANNTTNEMWAVALDDVGGGTAAHGTITPNGTATAAGNIYLYLGGTLVTVPVASGDDDEDMATAVAAAINANTELPVTAAAAAEVVTVTFRHKGTVGNKFDMRVNYRGALAGEVFPAGVTAPTLVQLASGATDPDITTAYAALPDEIYDYIVLPYISSTILNATDAELDDRWLATRMLEGHAFVADKGSVSTIGTLGNTRNNQHMSLFDAGINSPTPPYIWAAAVAGQIAKAASIDPARPFNGLEIVGVLPAPAADRRTQTERNTLLYDGVATHKVNSDGKVYVERLLTTYQKNSEDLPDATYLDANTPFTLAYLRQDFRARMSSRFTRFKLADDGTQTIGQTTTTPSGIKAECVAWASEKASQGLIEDLPNFIATIVVQRDTEDSSRVNIVMQPNLVNQLQIIATQIKFSL